MPMIMRSSNVGGVEQVGMSDLNRRIFLQMQRTILVAIFSHREPTNFVQPILSPVANSFPLTYLPSL